MVAEKSPSSARRNLFGGAITVQIPREFSDISVIRAVPDNQEVFSHAETDRSVIIELLELQDIPPDCFPAEFHLNSIAEDSGATEARTNKVITLSPSDFPALQEDDPSLSITAAYGTHVVSKFRDAAELASHVDVYVACVRLPRATTDLLVVFNDPRALHPAGSSARAGSTVASTQEDVPRDALLQMILTSLKIHDWSLLE